MSVNGNEFDKMIYTMLKMRPIIECLNSFVLKEISIPCFKVESTFWVNIINPFVVEQQSLVLNFKILD